MRLRISKNRRLRLLLAASTLLCAIVACAGGYLWWVDREAERAADLDRVVVTSEALFPPNAVGVTHWLPREAPRDVEPFAGKVFAATSGGLAEYDERGALLRRYTTLDGLPENTLLCLERFGDKLYIGTESSGLLAFDGERFVRYAFVRPAVSRVTALKAVPGALLVGTFGEGIFEFDGQTFSRRYQRAFGDSCKRVTSILDVGPRVFVGTFDTGLFEWREAASHHYVEADGLPSLRITGLALRDNTVVVATDLGVASVAASVVKPLDGVANVTGIAVRGRDTWIASLSHGVSRMESGAAIASTTIEPVVDASERPASTGGLPSSATGVKIEDGALWAVTSGGLFVSPSPDGPVRFERFDRPDSAVAPGLDSGHVASMAFDRRGRLWVGMFDGGIDVLDPVTGAPSERIDDPSLHEINAIVPDSRTDRMWVGSSRGLAAFDGTRLDRLLGERNGLVGENVAGIATDAGQSGGGVAVATNKGLTLVDGAVPRSITAFHGLPNNHAYAVAVGAGRTYVGTLGGLAVVDGLRVDRVYTAGDSNLTHNWVNALVFVDGRLYVGTYGGGVAVLEPSGRLEPVVETAGLEVNPGAMAVVDRKLFVGTLRSGLYTLDLDSGRWTKIAAVLTSPNVTAIAADARFLYVGTEHGIARIERSSLS